MSKRVTLIFIITHFYGYPFLSASLLGSFKQLTVCATAGATATAQLRKIYILSDCKLESQLVCVCCVCTTATFISRVFYFFAWDLITLSKVMSSYQPY